MDIARRWITLVPADNRPLSAMRDASGDYAEVAVLLLEKSEGGFTCRHFSVTADCLGDDWYETEEQARGDLARRFGAPNWRAVPTDQDEADQVRALFPGGSTWKSI